MSKFSINLSKLWGALHASRRRTAVRLYGEYHIHQINYSSEKRA
jgi:hypothetical protein